MSDYENRLLAALGGTPVGWTFTGQITEQDPASSTALRCACKHTGLRWLYWWQHEDGRRLATGSTCVATVPGLDPDGVARIREAEAERGQVRITVPDDVRAETIRVAQDCDALALRCQSYEVATREQYAGGGLLLREIKAQAASWEARRKKITVPMDEAKRQVMEEFRPRAEALDAASRVVSRALAGYETREREAAERKAAEERKRLADIEAARAEKERERLAEQALADRLRLAAEKAEAERLAKLAEPTEAERMAAQEAAERLEESKRQAEADRKEREYQEVKRSEEAQTTANRVSAAPVVTLAGVTFRDNWTFEIEDETLVPRQFLMVDEKALRVHIKSRKESCVGKIPGVRVYNDRGTATRAA